MPTSTAACGHSVTFVVAVFSGKDFENLLRRTAGFGHRLARVKSCSASEIGEDA